MFQWIESEILPLNRCGLAPAEENGLEVVKEGHYRARWGWPDPRFAARCRLVVTPQAPKPGASLDNLENQLAFTIDRATWDAGAGYRDLLVENDSLGSYVVVWAIVDIDFQTFNTEPIVIGRLQAEGEEAKKKGWSLFRRSKEE